MFQASHFNKNKDVIISIIIPCFNAEKFIKNCLDSILNSTIKNYEILIIDDGSQDKSKIVIKNYEKNPQIKIFYQNKNQGPAKARNLGAKHSQSKYLFFLDVDTTIDNDCLKAIVNKLEKSSEIGAIQTKLIQGGTDKIDSAGHFLSFFGFPYEIGVGDAEKNHNQEKLIFGGRSADLAIRKELFEKIQGFDEDYIIYGEDTDLCWRTWLAGYKMIYFPQAKVYHFPKSSLTEKTKHRIFYEGAKNNTSNIIKNASFSMVIWMLPLHLLAWLMLSLKLIFEKRVKLAYWIYKGFWWNIKNLNETLKKRRFINQVKKKNLAPKTILGEISFKTLFLKGLKWFKNV